MKPVRLSEEYCIAPLIFKNDAIELTEVLEKMRFLRRVNRFSFVFFLLIFGQVSAQKIEGISVVSQKFKLTYNCMPDIRSTGSNWVVLCPFGIMEADDVSIEFNSETNWYGDREKGLREQIQLAKSAGLNVCLKPHLYVKGMGWPGEYNPGWLLWSEWEKNYSDYLNFLTKIAKEEQADLLMIGTECKTAVNSRPLFWEGLIKSIRANFNGAVSYAANWDNYQNIPFWDKLDFVCIDAYFPISTKKTPSAEEVEKKWRKLSKELGEFASKMNRKIIFTEYGYRSTDNCAGRQWEIEARSNSEKVNLTAQANAYSGFYTAIWNQPWFAGGFVWKWYCNSDSGGKTNSDYTPQGKPALEIIKKVYQE